MVPPVYTLARLDAPPALDGCWNGGGWHGVPPLSIARFHPRSSIHRPIAEAKAAWSDEGLHVIFRVQDRYVRCVHTGFQAPVYKDSCAEFFMRPGGTGPYLNFEMNAGGTLLATCIADWTRTPDGFAKFERLDARWDAAISRFHSLPERVEPEIATPVQWALQYTLPWPLFESCTGAGRPKSGDAWTGNFYKCGDETSHPHWAAWAPVGEVLNFHQPERFGRLVFGA